MENVVKWVLGLGAAAIGYTVWQSRQGAKAKAATLASERVAGKIVGRHAMSGDKANSKYVVMFDVIDPQTGAVVRTRVTDRVITIPTSTAEVIWVDPPTLDNLKLHPAQNQAPADSSQAALINNEILRFVGEHPEAVIFP